MELFKILGTIAINNSEANKAIKDTSQNAKGAAKDVDDLGNSGEKSGGKLSAAFSKVGSFFAKMFEKDNTKTVEKSFDSLSATTEKQKEKLESLKNEYKNMYVQHGKNSSEAKKVATEIKQLSAEINKNESEMKKAGAAADKFDKSLDDVGDSANEADSKLSKFFSGVGKAAGVAAKGIAVGLGAAATAIGGLATSAIKQYADYEQLVGGSQLLFGDAFGYVEEQAKNAYKTVQMSTNEYLQQVNGFSTGLKTALGGNEQAAAELAHKIVVAEADIVAATGNSAENVQNAFNGIMKSNFTMLDNLQLGITPTKEGFQEVIDKVNEWNKANGEATNYQIDNLADCQSALVDYIEMQGLAGYASNEAAGTIQGSWGMLKGAWSNLLVGFSDPSADLQSLIDGVFESVTAFAGNLIPRISQVLSGIATAFKTLVPMIVGEIPGLLEQILPPLIEGATALVQGLVDVLPSIMNTLMDSLPALIEGVMSIVDALIGALPGILEAIVAALPTLIPMLIDAVVGLIMMLVEMLPQIIQPIIDYLPEIIVSIVDALLGNLPVLIQGCVQLIGALIAALPQILSALWEAIGGIFDSLGNMIGGWFEPVKNAVSNAWAAMGNVPGLAQLKTMIEQVWGAIKSYITTYITAIVNIVTTYWNAIKNVISTVINSIKNVISTVWNSIKTIISSVMKLISSVLKGDWEGVKSAISSIVNAIKAVISSVWNGIKNIISSVLNGIKSVVSSVWNGIKSVVTSYLNMIKTVVTSIWNGIKGAISNAMTGIKTTVVSAFKELPGKIKTVGKDLVNGLWNGITNAKDWLLNKIKGFAKTITKGIKDFFGIKSPSRVMRDEVGKMLAEGVAVGIDENAEVATNAMEELGDEVVKAAKKNVAKEKNASAKLGGEIVKLAKKRLATFKEENGLTAKAEAEFWDNIRQQCAEGTDARTEADKNYFAARNKIEEEFLDAAEKRLDEYATYNDLTLAEEVAFWDGIRQKCAEGTDARLEADKKYLAAKKSLNDQLLTAEQKLQKEIGSIQQSVADRTKEILNITGSGFGEALSYDELLGNLEHEVFGLEQYEKTIADLEKKIGGTKAFEDIKAGGIGNLNKAYEMAYFMPEDKLNEYVELYERKYAAANKYVQQEMSDEVIAKTAEAYQAYANTCAGLGVEIVDSTESMQQDVSESFGLIEDSITDVSDALKELKKLFDSFDMSTIAPGIASWFVGGSEFATQSPSAYSIGASGTASNEQDNWFVSFLQKFLESLQGMKVVLDSGALVGEIAIPMDEALGMITTRKDRGR